MQLENDGVFRCPDKFCSLGKEYCWWRLTDWNRIRYVSEAAPKVRRMKGRCNRTMCKHNGEHDYCGATCHEHKCQPVEPQAQGWEEMTVRGVLNGVSYEFPVAVRFEKGE
jgi:hypothetical protein